MLHNILSVTILRQMDGWMDGWMDGRTDGWMDGRTDGRMDGWIDRWRDGWMDGWMDGWNQKRLCLPMAVEGTIAPVNKLVSLTWLLWALRSFRSITLHYINT